MEVSIYNEILENNKEKDNIYNTHYHFNYSNIYVYNILWNATLL